jgi:acetate kinase
MKILVLNCGSSSLKFQLINVEQEELIAKGLVEKIGTGSAVLSYQPHNKNPLREVREIKNHEVALKFVLNSLTDKTVGVLRDITEIHAFGHRVVHGGERFSGSVLITPEVVNGIRECAVFAPLHNPANLMGIQACFEAVAGIEQVAVFDTAFHGNIRKHAFLYGLPYAMYEKLKIRRYGFHGTSHWYVSQKAAEILNREYHHFKVITCHLGNGSSIAAVRDGISVDTTMGFTPLEGLIMGTRCGDLDPAIVPYLMEKRHLSPEAVDALMNKASGLKGISRTTNDMREIEEAANAGSKLHQLALEMFCYRIKKYIGAYFGVLGGADAVVFTAGIGENSATVRRKSCEGLEAMGIAIDDQKNRNKETVISAGQTPVLIVPTNEELAIAKETYRVLQEHHRQRLEAQETVRIQTMLNTLTDADKAQIAILWSQNQHLSLEQLVGLIRDKMSLDLDVHALETLLQRIGFSKQLGGSA